MKFNDRLIQTERSFLGEGLPGRPFYKHVVQAPGIYKGYDTGNLSLFFFYRLFFLFTPHSLSSLLISFFFFFIQKLPFPFSFLYFLRSLIFPYFLLVDVFPGVVQALEEDNAQLAQQQLDIITERVQSATKTLSPPPAGKSEEDEPESQLGNMIAVIISFILAVTVGPYIGFLIWKNKEQSYIPVKYWAFFYFITFITPFCFSSFIHSFSFLSLPLCCHFLTLVMISSSVLFRSFLFYFYRVMAVSTHLLCFVLLLLLLPAGASDSFLPSFVWFIFQE